VDGPTVPVAVVASRTEAELIVGLLRSNGLRAAVSADDAGGQDPQLQLQGVRVLVAPSDEASARRILAAVDDHPSSIEHGSREAALDRSHQPDRSGITDAQVAEDRGFEPRRVSPPNRISSAAP
jgi:hypothetical protein